MKISQHYVKYLLIIFSLLMIVGGADFLCKQSPLVSEDELTVLPTIRRKGAFLLRGEDKVNKCLYCGKETRNLKFCSYSCKGKFYSGKKHGMFGKHHSEKQKKKWCKDRKKNYNLSYHKKDCQCSFCKAMRGELTGDNHHMFGKHHSKKAKRKMAKTKKEYFKTHPGNRLGVKLSKKSRKLMRKKHNMTKEGSLAIAKTTSKRCKGKIPKNLSSNIRMNNSPMQKKLYNVVKLYFKKIENNYFVRTKKTHRFLDVAVPELMLDFEYNGIVHIMKNVQANDKQRTKELIELGWKVVIIDRNNWSSVHNIVKQEILNKLKEIRCV